MRRRKSLINFFYVPVLAIFIIFVIIPFFMGIRISFTNWTGYLPDFKDVGWANYIKLFTMDQYLVQVLINTIIYGFGSTIFQNIIGLLFALFLNKKFPVRGVFRTIVYLPVMIAPLIMGYILFYVLQYSGGALNDIMALFGQESVDWLAAPGRTVFIITLINTLQYCGVSMVLYLAGLQNIPSMYTEAAEIDGVNALSRFRYITFPLLMPAIASSVIINLIGGLKLFDIIRALTPPSPTTGAHSLSTYLTYQYFNMQQAGYSAVIGIMTFLLILVVSNIAMRYFDKREATML